MSKTPFVIDLVPEPWFLATKACPSTFAVM
jgi:hypothetical protein